MWRRRVRSTAKWACTMSAMTVALAWVVSLRWTFRWEDGARIAIVAEGGSVWSVWSKLLPEGFRIAADDFSVERRAADMKWQEHWLSSSQHDQDLHFILVPFWIPIALTLPPAALLWRGDIKRHRLAKKDACTRCGYDRHGLALDAMCPECGTVPSAASQ